MTLPPQKRGHFGLRLFDDFFNFGDKVGWFSLGAEFFGSFLRCFFLIELVQRDPFHRVIEDPPEDFDADIGRCFCAGFSFGSLFLLLFGLFRLYFSRFCFFFQFFSDLRLYEPSQIQCCLSGFYVFHRTANHTGFLIRLLADEGRREPICRRKEAPARNHPKSGSQAFGGWLGGVPPPSRTYFFRRAA